MGMVCSVSKIATKTPDQQGRRSNTLALIYGLLSRLAVFRNTSAHRQQVQPSPQNRQFQESISTEFYILEMSIRNSPQQKSSTTRTLKKPFCVNDRIHHNGQQNTVIMVSSQFDCQPCDDIDKWFFFPIDDIFAILILLSDDGTYKMSHGCYQS
jgi:hypothetical protein